MTVAKVIRYRVKPELADENERLIRMCSPSWPSRSPTVCATRPSGWPTVSASFTSP